MQIQLQGNATDRIVTTLKACLGAISVNANGYDIGLGSLLAELVSSRILNQRMDRIADFVQQFADQIENRLSDLESFCIEQEVQVNGFSDLLEDVLHQVVRATSKERRGYLASLLASTLTTEQVSQEEARRLLGILAELTDIEIIWLRAYCGHIFSGFNEFRNRHKNVLDPVMATYGSGDEERNAHALQKSYSDHLIRLGLVHQDIVTNSQGEPVFEPTRREFKTRTPRTTDLGVLLLRQIGIIPSA